MPRSQKPRKAKSKNRRPRFGKAKEAKPETAEQQQITFKPIQGGIKINSQAYMEDEVDDRGKYLIKQMRDLHEQIEKYNSDLDRANRAFGSFGQEFMGGIKAAAEKAEAENKEGGGEEDSGTVTENLEDS